MKFFASILKAYQTFKATRFGKAFVRTQYRSACLLGLTIAAATAMEFMVQSARFGVTDLAARFPEMIAILRALSIMTWYEQGLLWIRLAVSPKIDLNELCNKLTGDGAHSNTNGIIVVYVTNHLIWFVRLIVLYKLCGF